MRNTRHYDTTRLATQMQVKMHSSYCQTTNVLYESFNNMGLKDGSLDAEAARLMLRFCRLPQYVQDEAHRKRRPRFRHDTSVFQHATVTMWWPCVGWFVQSDNVVVFITTNHDYVVTVRYSYHYQAQHI